MTGIDLSTGKGKVVPTYIPFSHQPTHEFVSNFRFSRILNGSYETRFGPYGPFGVERSFLMKFVYRWGKNERGCFFFQKTLGRIIL